MTLDIEKLRSAIPATRPPFALKKLGHVVIKVTDLQRSLAFYAGVLGFKVSDIIGEDMMPGHTSGAVRNRSKRRLRIRRADKRWSSMIYRYLNENSNYEAHYAGANYSRDVQTRVNGCFGPDRLSAQSSGPA
jgi:hypothetical protein